LLFLAALPGFPGGARSSRPFPYSATDSIYSLAVDSARYPRDPYVFLLDDGVVRYEADGRGSRTYRQVVQILKETAVERWAEHSFGYEPKRERLTVNWIRVVSPTGEIISDKPGITQDADVPAPMGDPSYVERKIRRMSLPNVRPGTLVDFSYTIEEFKPFRPGDFFTGWRVSPGIPVRRSRLVLDTPVSLTPRIMARNLDFRPDTVIAAGRRVVTWATQDVQKIEPEPFAADSNDVDQTISIAGPGAWKDVGAWYAELARDRYTVTPGVAQKLAAVVSGALTLEDSVKAVHRYVARDVRYVAISLGMGGYQPRSVSDVVATGYGDCKDKATLFIAMAARLGVTAYPVLLSAGGDVDRRLPTIFQFNHAIAVVERPSGRLFVDLTAGDVPWGALPMADHDQFVLVVHPDGRTEETRTPANPANTARNDLVVDAVLDSAGFATSRIQMVVTGPAANSLRDMFGASMDSIGRASFVRQAASNIFPEAEGDSLSTIDQLDQDGSFTLGFLARNGRAAQLAGSVAILTLPQARQQRDVKPLIAELLARPRVYPIDVGQASPGSGSIRFRIDLPVGWNAEPPQDAALRGPFGELTIRYAQLGRTLSVSVDRKGREGVLPKSRLKDLVAWLESVAVAEREAGSIVISRSR
jgi:transglutaminase-like putative cysteine protease